MPTSSPVVVTLGSEVTLDYNVNNGRITRINWTAPAVPAGMQLRAGIVVPSTGAESGFRNIPSGVAGSSVLPGNLGAVYDPVTGSANFVFQTQLFPL